MGIDVLLIELNKNPMFHLSLGSKELFHSNFLAFLWDQNPKLQVANLKKDAEAEAVKKL